MSQNRNLIVTDTWSNPESDRLYGEWRDDPVSREFYEHGRQCGGCSCFGKLNSDWGLCLHPRSRHHLETVFEHFTCPAHVDEGWGPHSFADSAETLALLRHTPPSFIERLGLASKSDGPDSA